MRTNLVCSFIILVIAFALVILINRNSAITNAQAALQSAQVSNEAYAQSQQTSQVALFAVGAFTLVLLIGIWGKSLRRWVAAMFLLLPLLAACSGAQATPVITKPNEVTFVIQLNGDNTNQAVVGGTTDYWTQHLVNTKEITITQYCFQPGGPSSPCQNRDAVAVVVVDTSSVNVQWTAPAIVAGQPLPDMSNAFSMQSFESNGGSTGVYTGAQLIAHIAPADAALYLASYGYTDMNDRHVYPARPLTDVLNGEVRAYIQTRLNEEYGKRSVVQQNQDLSAIFATVQQDLTTTFGAKGITIDSFGNRDGNVYENPAIQQAIDSAFDRQRQLEAAQADATRQAVVNGQMVDAAYAGATATAIAADAAAYSQQQQAAVLNQSPTYLQYLWIQRWNGQMPQITGNDNAMPVVPVSLVTPVPTAVSTPTP